ncbi:hypothetical protein K9B35_13045 [Sphingomonas sp. R647]|uniref:hypothetical protein n=1 Tax=Sphingomonas sp. R647 TaxID=2875233 RepID=UPI001CD5B2F8|nr:hypothetical protein [Sphingomonas sp. R647]MCA1198896.1 hypothetical protein [Sphingomonas sp. R647]
MITVTALALTLAAVQGDLAPTQDAPAPAAIDWESLPALPYREAPSMTPAMHDWARGQVNARKCRARRLVDGRPAVRIEVAVLVDEEGVRTTIPRATGCPTVEQYAAGLVAGFSRNNLTQRTAAPTAWYRATVTFAWRQ